MSIQSVRLHCVRIPEEVCPWSMSEKELPYCRLVETYLKETGVWDNVEWGDVIEDQSRSGYRMNGVCMVGKNENGDLKVVPLSTYPDDYGSIPTEFYTPLFTPDAIYESDDPSFNKASHYAHTNYVPVLPSEFHFLPNVSVSIPIRRFNTQTNEYETMSTPSLVAIYDDIRYIFPVPYPETFMELTTPIYMEPVFHVGFEDSYILTLLYEPTDCENGEEFYDKYM